MAISIKNRIVKYQLLHSACLDLWLFSFVVIYTHAHTESSLMLSMLVVVVQLLLILLLDQEVKLRMCKRNIEVAKKMWET